MPDELPKQIDRELKSYAEKRRKTFEPAVPPRLRQALQREVEQTYASPQEIRLGAFLKKYWPQFGVAVAASLLMASGLFLYEGKKKNEQLATSKTYESENFFKKSTPERSDTKPEAKASSGNATAPVQLSLPASNGPAREEAQRLAPRESATTKAPAVPAPQSTADARTTATRTAPVPAPAQDSNRRFMRQNRTLSADTKKEVAVQETKSQAASPGSKKAAETEERKIAVFDKSQTQEASRDVALTPRPANPQTELKEENLAAEAVSPALVAASSTATQPVGATISAQASGPSTLDERLLNYGTNGLADAEANRLDLVTENNVKPVEVVTVAQQLGQARSALSNFYQQSGQQTPKLYSYGLATPMNLAVQSFVNNANAGQSQVLQNFRFVNQSPVIKIVDGDGSVYTGNVLNVSIAAKDQTKFSNSQADIRGGGIGGGQTNLRGMQTSNIQPEVALSYSKEAGVPFFVQGVNQTLNKQVQVTGQWIQNNSPVPLEQPQKSRARKMMSPREATSNNNRSTNQMPLSAPSATISGMIQVGETNSYPLEAVIPSQP